MLLNQARCDYLTLTTFVNHDQLLQSIADLYPINHAKEAKMGGYTGHQWEGLFFGVGKQRRKAHTMLRASGEGSETIFWRTRLVITRCTRLDLQITTYLPKVYNARTTYDTLSSLDVDWPGRRLTPHLIQSGDGFDTIYIGSRTSDRFGRIYVKADHKGRPAYLRFEMELKGSIAQSARDAIAEQRATAKTILKAELDRLPFAASRALRTFSDLLGSDSTKIRPENVVARNSTLDWLENQVEPAVLRMLASHEHGDRMRAILNRWVSNSTPPDLSL